jgi:hypothetical protein
MESVFDYVVMISFWGRFRQKPYSKASLYLPIVRSPETGTFWL